jgi:4-amino-4-deoxy-L-arabinose transferase-like glycosyltransferase
MSILGGSDLKPWIGAVAVATAAGILYFLTAARDIIVGDSPELITAAVTLGVAHPPGYPLFTMLGHLFSLLPFGAIPFRLNLLSVVCDALTIGVVYFTALRLTRSQLAAAVAALLLAINPTFWEWSLAAEVFPLNNLLAAVLILLLVAWHEQQERNGFLIAAFFVAGLALTNHHTSVLLAPAFCLVLWQQRSILLARPGLLVIGVALFLLGLLPYAYMPWASARHPVYNWGEVSSVRDFLGVITRRNYGTFRLFAAAGYTGGSPLIRIAALCLSFGLVAGTLIVLGAIQTYRRQRWYFWFSLIAFTFAGPFFVWITNLNLRTAPSALFVLQRFFLLPQIILAPLIALGVLALAEVVSRSIRSSAVTGLRLAAAACVVAVAITGATNYRRIDQSRNSIARIFAEDVFATIPPGSVLFANGDIAFTLMYAQKLQNIGKDTTLVLLPLLSTGWYVKQLQREHPDLVVPFDRYDLQTKNLKMVVDANRARTICIAGTIGIEDHSLDEDYWPSQHGLLITVEPKSKTIGLDEMIAENESLLARCHPPVFATVRASTFEADILNMYAWPAFRIGNDCARVGLKDRARIWFDRALEIDPNFPQAREALARLEH